MLKYILKIIIILNYFERSTYIFSSAPPTIIIYLLLFVFILITSGLYIYMGVSSTFDILPFLKHNERVIIIAEGAVIKHSN